MTDQRVIFITGTRKGIGRYLAEYYAAAGNMVVGCSRQPMDAEIANYRHYCLDVTDEAEAKRVFLDIQETHGRLDVLVNNAGIASMNHFLLTPIASVQKVFNTNLVGTFLFCREAAKLMRRNRQGRIVNFTTVAVPLRLQGEAAYAASKAAVMTLTQVMARELADFGITVNAVGPTPIETDLIQSVPQEKIQDIIERQSIHRFGEFRDVSNVIDFFIRPESDFITGQILFLGGVG